MYDIAALEKQWEEYTRKKRNFRYIVAFSLFFILVSLYFTYVFVFSQKEIQVSPSRFAADEIIIDSSIDKLLKPEPEEKAEIMEVDDDVKPVDPVIDIPVLEDKIVKKQPKVPQQPYHEKKKIHFRITEKVDLKVLNDIEQRFMRSHDIDDALFLAKNYYDRGNYEKAEYWALKTNKLNSGIDESWIIFAKAKAKMGHKQEAIGILESYLKKSHSDRIRNVLEKLRL